MDNRDRKSWRVLYVNHLEGDYLFTHEMLRKAQGRKIVLDWAATYSDGLLRLQADPYDAALVEYDLSPQTGIDFIREAISQGYQGALILYTEDGNYEMDEQAIQAGATRYITRSEMNPMLLARSIRYAIERKRIETERAHILESIQDGFFALDKDWRFTFLNKKAAQISQYEPDDLIGRTIWETYPKLVGTPLEQAYQRVMKERKSIRLEAQGVYQGNWYNISIFPTHDGISVFWQDITEKVTAEQEARRNEGMYRAIARNLPGGGVVVVDREMRYLIAEGPLLTQLGMAPEKLEGHTPRETLDERIAKISEERFREALHGESTSFEAEYLGRQIWTHYLPLRDEQGQVIAAMVLALDITDRKQVENNLLESEQQQREMAISLDMERSRLATVLENLPVGVWIADSQGKLIGKNQHADKIWAGNAPLLDGVEQYQEYNAWFSEGGKELLPDDYPVARVLETAHAIEPVELNIRRLDGSEGTVLASAAPILDSEGKLTGAVGVNLDISERKRVEEALRQSEIRFRQLADAMPQLVWTAQPDGKVDYYNQRFQEYHGITFGYQTSWQWAPVLHSEDLQPTVKAWLRSVETGEVYQIEHRVRMANGDYRWHLSRAVLARDEKGQAIKWFGTATDIHDLKQAEDVLKSYTVELERSNRDLQEFAFVVSHDLQEPLRKIETLGNMIVEEGGNLSDGQIDKFYRLRNSIRRMRNMVEGLLLLSRLSTQEQPFQKVDVGQVMDEVLSDLDLQIKRTGGVVEVGKLPVIQADPIQMRQLLQNLVGNALKFHAPGEIPSVEVTSHQPTPESVQIIIKDNGIGFDQKNLDLIFQPFKRLVGKSEYDGLGLGLAICRKIVWRLGGEITACSESNKGATFIVTLPVQGR